MEHIESQSLNGVSVIKVFLQPKANVDGAIAEVAAKAKATLKQLPTGITPPLIINYSASTVPILQLALSGQGLSEQQLNDYGSNFIRPLLSTVPGAAVPVPYGGKVQQIVVGIDSSQLQAKGLSDLDIVNAVNAQNVIVPSGTVKIAKTEFNVGLNGTPVTVQQLNDLPVKTVNGGTIFVKDVAHVRDGFAVQTNIVSYNIAVQTPQYRVASLDALQSIPVNSPSAPSPQLFSNLAAMTPGEEPAVVNHYNLAPVIDVYASVQNRDLGGVAADVAKITGAAARRLPRGSKLVTRGQVATMKSSFTGLFAGLALAVVLVYLLLVVNFHSWSEAFIIITALPGALAGICWMLLLTHTTLSVPALMGTIMAIGVATSNSVLITTFANEHFAENKDSFKAALEAGGTLRHDDRHDPNGARPGRRR